MQVKGILGQELCKDNEEVLLYQCGKNFDAVISSLVACNVGDSNAKIDVRVVWEEEGDTFSPKQLLYHNLVIPAGETFVATMGITIDSNEKIFVGAVEGSVAFNLFGAERTK